MFLFIVTQRYNVILHLPNKVNKFITKVLLTWWDRGDSDSMRFGFTDRPIFPVYYPSGGK